MDKITTENKLDQILVRQYQWLIYFGSSDLTNLYIIGMYVVFYNSIVCSGLRKIQGILLVSLLDLDVPDQCLKTPQGDGITCECGERAAQACADAANLASQCKTH